MRSTVLNAMPRELRALIRGIGANLRVARQRRRETIEQFAARVGVNRNTLAQMERGSPAVSFGAYASALWVIGMAEDLGLLASPERDTQGKLLELDRLPGKVQPRRSTKYAF